MENDVKLSSNVYKSIVVLSTDVPDILNSGGSYKHLIFTTKGKIDIFRKAVEMTKIKGSLTLQVDCSGTYGVCFIQVGVSDFKCKYYSLMYGIINSENAETSLRILEVCDQVFKTLDLDTTSMKYSLLKDGSPSFIQPALTIGLGELACMAHMGRLEGVGKNNCW